MWLSSRGQGYTAATLKAVGELAGIPTASVYHYFADRHQLEAELVQRHIAELDSIFTGALERNRARTVSPQRRPDSAR